jgi:hypothetical protein
MFGSLLAIVIFGLMLLVTAYGFVSSERAVKNHDSMRLSRERASGLPAEAPPDPAR